MTLDPPFFIDSANYKVIDVAVADSKVGDAGVLGTVATNAYKVGENVLHPTKLRTRYRSL